MKKALVTGCAGFIGSHMVDFLLKEGFVVLGIDNLSTGKLEFIYKHKKNKKFLFVKKDLIKDKIDSYFKKAEIIFHFAANADVRYGIENRFRDIEQNIIGTYNVLEATIKHKVKIIVFASTGSVYGESKNFPTNEKEQFPIQTSLYANSKLAGEGLISSFCAAFDLKSFIFRFVSILGERYSHGHVFDFTKLLLLDNKKLKILGDGNQKKSYLHVEDCISGIWRGLNYFKSNINIINLGTENYINVKESAKIITKQLNFKPKMEFKGGKSGWVGDNPFILLDISKIKKSGWIPKYDIKESIISTVNYLINNQWLFKIRK